MGDGVRFNDQALTNLLSSSTDHAELGALDRFVRWPVFFPFCPLSSSAPSAPSVESSSSSQEPTELVRFLFGCVSLVGVLLELFAWLVGAAVVDCAQGSSSESTEEIEWWRSCIPVVNGRNVTGFCVG